MNYSIVCGRIHAYQRGDSNAFRYSVSYSPIVLGVPASTDSAYVSGLSLTHGLVGQRKHVWTFAGARDEATTYRINNNNNTLPSWSPVSTLHSPGPMKFPLMLVTVTSVTLVLILITTITFSTWTTLSGMVRAVVDLAPAAVLIVLHGFVSI